MEETVFSGLLLLLLLLGLVATISYGAVFASLRLALGVEEATDSAAADADGVMDTGDAAGPASDTATSSSSLSETCLRSLDAV
jgi:hypothetical protein